MVIPLPDGPDWRLFGRSPWIGAIAICLLGGLLLRWVNLEGKVFWHDEVFTALRVTGHLGQNVEAQVFSGDPLTAAALLQFQTFAPGSTFTDTWRSLLDHPEHPPLYYVLAWGWVKILGPSIATFRSLSVIFSGLTVPLLALLARELFGRHPAVFIAPLLFAVSPVQVLYAQEARGYSLWVGLTVLSTWALLRATRLNTRLAWGTYAFTLTLLFYGSILSVLIAIAHGLYGIWCLPRQRWVSGGRSLLIALILFGPWLGLILLNLARVQSITAWALAPLPRSLLIKLWGLHFAALFVDPYLPIEHPYTVVIPPLLLLLVGISLVRCWQQFPRRTSVLLLLLIGIPTLTLMGSDLVRGSHLSYHTRYFLPALTAAQVTIAGWLGNQARSRPRLGALSLLLLVGIGLVNSGAIVQATTWWNKGSDLYNREIAQAIAAEPQALVLTQQRDTTLGNLISLSYYLPPATRFQATQGPDIPVPTRQPGETLLLYQPSESMLTAYGCPAEPYPDAILGPLWRVPCR